MHRSCKVAGAAPDVHDGVGATFNNPIMILRLVLVLMIGFRFILRDENGAENISTHLGDFNFPPSVIRVAMVTSSDWKPKYGQSDTQLIQAGCWAHLRHA